MTKSLVPWREIRILGEDLLPCRLPRDIEATLDDDLVGFEESGDLDLNPFPAARTTRDAGHLGHITTHGDGDAAEELDSLGDGVDHLNLLVEVFVEEEVELVEGWARKPASGASCTCLAGKSSRRRVG